MKKMLLVLFFVAGWAVVGFANGQEMVEIVIDDADTACFAVTGDEWNVGTEPDNYKEIAYWIFPGQKKEVKAVWTPEVKVAGEYEVFVWIGSDSAGNHATDAPFTVTYSGGSKTVRVDFAEPKNWGNWKSIGVYKFDAGKKGNVTLTTDADGNLVADAVKFVLKKKTGG